MIGLWLTQDVGKRSDQRIKNMIGQEIYYDMEVWCWVVMIIKGVMYLSIDLKNNSWVMFEEVD